MSRNSAISDMIELFKFIEERTKKEEKKPDDKDKPQLRLGELVLLLSVLIFFGMPFYLRFAIGSLVSAAMELQKLQVHP